MGSPTWTCNLDWRTYVGDVGMAKILFSMCGEGRGHATRVQTIVDRMKHEHSFILLAARDAYDQLYVRYMEDPKVVVRRLPGLFFAYQGQRVNYFKSVFGAIPYLRRLGTIVRHIQQMIERDKPDLGITDFEPALPRAAAKCKLPWISLDHQHFLSVSDFSRMPWRFRWRAWFLRLSIPLFYTGQSSEVVSSFHHFPARSGTDHVQRIGVLLRVEIIEAKKNSPHSEHLVVYLRKHAPDNLWPALMATGCPCHIYGLGEKPSKANLQFHAIDNNQFVKHLATSYCLITTAGNQLVGEAMYLEKPVLAIPEDGNFEQGLNSRMVLDSGCGWTSSFKDITPHFLQQFLLAVPQLRCNIVTDDLCGNDRAIQIIQQHLSQCESQRDRESVYPNAS